MENIVRTLKGFSGSHIYLMTDKTGLFVRKIGSVVRNIERLTDLHEKQYAVPCIYSYDSEQFDMEYIDGTDIISYLKTNEPVKLLEFLVNVIEQLKKDSVLKDYTKIYHSKLQEIDFSLLPFTTEQLIAKLPTHLPQSNYIGDLTLENIIPTVDSFYLIDCVTVEYDSYIFDIAKLRQDLDAHWFTRDIDIELGNKTDFISSKLKELYPPCDNDYLLILMLLRVYKHAKIGSSEHDFLLDKIKKIWAQASI